MYIIYDQDYPMCAHMTAAEVIAMAEDVLHPKTLQDHGFAPYPGLCHRPENDEDMLTAATQVLTQHWGLFEYYSQQDTGEFIWWATERNLDYQALALVRLHDPEFARIEFGG